MNTNENTIDQLLGSFSKISLENMNDVSFLNRVDTKFMLHINKVPQLLKEMSLNYDVLMINNKVLHSYESIYYDTPSLLLYQHHHNGKLNRMKVRLRHYMDTQLYYFEVKYKVQIERTNKIRRKRSNMDFELCKEEQDLIHYPSLNINELSPCLSVYYKRITLVNKNKTERITLDVMLHYHGFNHKTKSLSDIVILELKSNKRSLSTPILNLLKKLDIYKVRFSKYALGIAFLKTIKHNNLKKNLLKIERLISKS